MKSLIAGIMGVVALAGVAQFVFANSTENKIEARIQPVAHVCVKGQACAQSLGSNSSGQSASSASAKGGKKTFEQVCSNCHKSGVMGAPKFGSYKDWAPRIAKGMDTLYHAAEHGYKAMPPKGTCMSCTNAQLKAAVNYMVDAAKKNKPK